MTRRVLKRMTVWNTMGTTVPPVVMHGVFRYDAEGRLSLFQPPMSESTPLPTYTYERDALGRPADMYSGPVGAATTLAYASAVLIHMIQNHRSSMRQRVGFGALAVLASLCAACADDTRFPHRYYNLTEIGLVRKAELIVVARTKDVQRSTMTVPAKWTGQPFIATARLLSVTVAVENIIKGSVKSDELTVTYWAADAYTNAHSLNIPAVGERAVHYLVSDKGSTRYVTDVISSKTTVRSGAHRDQLAIESGTPEVRIARILLTPGEGFDPEEFVAGLGTTVQRSLDLVGFMGTLPLMNSLLDSKDLRVQEQTCAEMYRQPFLGQDSCIDKLSSGDNRPNQELYALRAARMNATLRFKPAFLANPIRTAKDYAVIDGPEGTLDFLRLVAQHPDKQIAARAQSEIQTCCKNRLAATTPSTSRGGIRESAGGGIQ